LTHPWWVTTDLVSGQAQASARAVAGAELTYPRYGCRVVGGADLGLWRESDGPELAIGTAPGNDLELRDSTVSRHHCAIRVDPGGFHLRDLGSTNGTWVGGLRIEDAYIENGTVLRLGATRVRFDVMTGLVHERLAIEPRLGALLGRSAAMRRLFAHVARLAVTDLPVLIEGAPGTGKTCIAETMHGHSLRAAAPLIAVECASLPAARLPRDLLDGAHRGTLLLDDVEELDPAAQVHLVELLLGRLLTARGPGGPEPLDVRIIATASRDLRADVNQGRFRLEILGHFHHARVRVPTLAERPDDVPLLTWKFWREMTGDHDAMPPEELLERLTRHAWPANVRELRDAVDRAVRRRSRRDPRRAIGTGSPVQAPDDARASAEPRAVHADQLGEPFGRDVAAGQDDPDPAAS
jgi:hypothetical protein